MTKVCSGGIWCLLLLLVQVQLGQAQVCDWDQDSDPQQGLDIRSLDAGAQRLAVLREVKDMENCRKACCAEPDCQLALLGTPADGSPECHLVACLVEGRDVCVTEPSDQFEFSRKKVEEPSVPVEKELREHRVVALGAEEPRDGEGNDNNNIRCRLPMKVGPCRAAFPKFYYDATNQSCRHFIYGGCYANGNNFNTRKECEQSCNGVTGPVLPDESTPAPVFAPKAARVLPAHNPSPGLSMDVKSEPSEPVPTSPPAPLPEMSAADFAEHCEAEPQVGPCRASMSHWYYNSETHTCQSFIYGGCQGNKNNYISEESCMAACTVIVVPSSRRAPAEPEDQTEDYTVPTSPPAPLPEMSAADFAEHCEAESQVGPCRASMSHWYYNSETHTCQSFIYGGCRGNKNNYISEESCMAACTVTVVPSSRRAPAEPEDQTEDYTEHCTGASDTGPCRGALPMFYFQPSTGTCQPFIYGGCRGNKNRYSTVEECMIRCTGMEGGFEERGGKAGSSFRPRAFFLVGTLASIGVLLLVAFIFITLRRKKLLRCNKPQRSSISDKEELLTDPDDQSSVESLSVQGSPKVDTA